MNTATEKLFESLKKKTVTAKQIQKLIADGADVAAEENFGSTPLLEILQGRSVESDFDCIKALIYAGADPSFRKSDNKTNASDYIDSYGERHLEVKREEMVKLLERVSGI